MNSMSANLAKSDRAAHAPAAAWTAPRLALAASTAVLLAWTVVIAAQEPPAAPDPGTNAPPRAVTNAPPELVTNAPPEPATNAVPEPADRPPGEPAEATDAGTTNAPASPEARTTRETRALPAAPVAVAPASKEDAAPRSTNATARPRPEGSREPARETAAARPNPITFDSFKLVIDRNIFDPNRTPRHGSAGPVRRVVVVDSFSLVGTMSYGKGTFAVFDGSSAEYRKVLKTSGKIADYKLTEITDRRVKLASGTNTVEMAVGTQLHREEAGEWTFVAQAGSYGSGGGPPNGGLPGRPSAAPGGAPGGATGADSDVLKKLMERRAKEMNP
jgi:hypothetical protein